MPRYFFHIHDDLSLPDRDGIDLAGPEAARTAAMAGARAMMCEQLKKGRLSLHDRIEVESEGGEPIFSLSFGEAARSETTDPN